MNARSLDHVLKVSRAVPRGPQASPTRSGLNGDSKAPASVGGCRERAGISDGGRRTPPSVRLSAAKAVLDTSFRAAEIEDLEFRIAMLEQVAGLDVQR